MAENNTKKQLKLKIVTPAGTVLDVFCNSVRLTLPCDENGSGGGSLGIRPGHLPAMISVGSGRITAFGSDSSKIAEHSVGEGFATVADDVVTVLTSKA
ncbi:MAG: hypothetical protein IJC94_03000 [Oscillospiraceae bacterium]|nr:hypothetical protein [Oscillospiraceae bacterium]